MKRGPQDSFDSQPLKMNKPVISKDHQFQSFVDSLCAMSSVEPSVEFKKKLTKEDRDAMHEYILSLLGFSFTQTIYSLFGCSFKQTLYNLKPGQSIRFAKETTKLKRTFQIWRDENGDWNVIPSTKSKPAAYPKAPKETREKRAGSFKTGKPAFISNRKVKGKEPEVFDLVIRTVTILQETQEEIRTVQALNPEYVAKLSMGSTYTDKASKKLKFNVIGEKAQGTLTELIAQIDYNTLCQNRLNKLIYNLLLCVKEVHDANLVHLDIKPDNILFYEGEKLKIADFGFTVIEGTIKDAGTPCYLSPELYADCKTNPDMPKDLPGGIAYQEMCLENKAPKSDVKFKAHKANDMWALGILILELMHQGEEPNLADPQIKEEIKNNPLLKGLLAYDRNERADIDKAISLFKGMNTEVTTNNLTLFSLQKQKSTKVAPYLELKQKRSRSSRLNSGTRDQKRLRQTYI